MFELGLIGCPIKHSLSPWIHESFLRDADLLGNYSLYEITPHESFEVEISKLKDLQLDGFNVTVPYKQKIIPFLDEIDEEAKAIGAVNTVLNKDGKWVGYNTDGKGYIRSLTHKYPFLFDNKSLNILILGAGGAARGIFYALTSLGCENIAIANRTQESAKEIARLAFKHTVTKVITIKEAEQKQHDYDLIIQTTSVGMNPNSEKTIISLDSIKKTSIVSDIVYQPIETRLLNEAKKSGALIHYGHTMLLYQAQYAFEIWTNQRVPVKNKDKELEQKLKGR